MPEKAIFPTTSRCAFNPDRLSSATARIESSWAFHGVICAMWPSNAASGAMPSRSRMPAGSTWSGSKRALSKLLYTWVAKGCSSPTLNLRATSRDTPRIAPAECAKTDRTLRPTVVWGTCSCALTTTGGPPNRRATAPMRPARGVLA